MNGKIYTVIQKSGISYKVAHAPEPGQKKFDTDADTCWRAIFLR